MNLAFLAPALLAGLAVIAIPTLIHLISKRRARRVKFAPIELLLRSKKRTARSIRLRQILLLLLRTLLFACAALAIAQPLLKAEVGPKATLAPLVVVVAVDTSASMHAEVDGRSMFQSARARALDELRGMPADVRVGAVACDDAPRDLVAPTFERAAVVDAVSALAARHHRGDLLACAARATSLARSVEGEGERRVVVLSDLAAHGFDGPSAAAAYSGIDGTGIVVEWVRAAGSGDPPPPNHGIARVDVARTAGRSGDALEVTFEAARFLGPTVDVTADLLVGPRRAARLSLSMAGGQRVSRTFHHALSSPPQVAPPGTGTPGTPGAPAAYGQPAYPTSVPDIEQAPRDDGAGDGDEVEGAGQLAVALSDDALSLDNVVHLPFEIPAPVSVLVVDGAPQAVPFRDEVFYLESALRGARGAQGRLAVEVIGGDQLKPASLAGKRVVILANVARVDEATGKALAEHVRAGGGLFMTMGDQVDVESWNRALNDVLPAPLRGTKGQALLDDASVAEVLSFARFRAEHPVLRSLAAGAVDELPGLSRVRTHTLMLIEPGSSSTAASPSEVLVRFSNDAPALIERTVGDGRVILLATTIDRDWSDLAIRPGFLPLVRQIVLHLAGALDDGGPRILRVGEPRTIRLARGTEQVEVIPPSGDRVKLTVEDGAVEVVFKDTLAPGLYRVMTRTAGGDARERKDERFTVLIDPAESDLTEASREMLAQATPTGAVTRTREAGDDDVPLWPWLLLLAVTVIGVESLVLWRGIRSTR